MRRFTHARPDLQLLRHYTHTKFGWPEDKVDVLLEPVLKARPDRTSALHAQCLALPAAKVCHRL